MFLKRISPLNQVFIVEVVLFFLIIFGVLPRWCAFILAGILVLYTLLAPLEDALILFVRSIPLFIALPFTASFDNFNTWRILALIIFAKWLWQRPKITLPKHAIALIILGVIACLSVFVAPDKHLAILRIIYFANLLLVPIVIFHTNFQERILKNLAAPVLIATAIGFVQLVLTYFIDIYQFVYFWGDGVQCRQFGSQWCHIATHVGNTWFAYFGDQLSLRLFSLFTDSHTFPIFLLLGLPAIFIWKTKWKWVAIGFVYLAVILSGTRGIWAASLPIAVWSVYLAWRRPEVRKIAGSLLLFFALFVIAWPIFNSPQFLLAHGGFGHRVKSVFDFDETSNKARIAIWKASVLSIEHHPFLGVGIGNFPVVLNERQELSRAGSSAHNLYLHIAAEMGIFALAAFLWFLWLVFKKLEGPYLIFLPWIFIYVLTDVALFDERAFLITATVIAYVLATSINQPRLS